MRRDCASQTDTICFTFWRLSLFPRSDELAVRSRHNCKRYSSLRPRISGRVRPNCKSNIFWRAPDFEVDHLAPGAQLLQVRSKVYVPVSLPLIDVSDEFTMAKHSMHMCHWQCESYSNAQPFAALYHACAHAAATHTCTAKLKPVRACFFVHSSLHSSV